MKRGNKKIERRRKPALRSAKIEVAISRQIVSVLIKIVVNEVIPIASDRWLDLFLWYPREQVPSPLAPWQPYFHPTDPRLANWKVFDGQGLFFTIAHGALLVACYYFDIVWVKIYEHLAPCWLRSNWLLNYFVAGFPPVANGPLANATPVISGSRGCTGKLDCVAPYHRGGWRIKLTSYVFGTAGHWLRSQQRIYDFICQPSCQRQRAGV